MAGVKLVNVTKRFGETEAIKSLSLEVADKEFVVICGPPGAGKTTLLRVIAGLEKVDEGEVYLGDDLVNDVPPAERDVSMVFENLALYPTKTGFENIAFPLKSPKLKTPPDEVRKRVLEVAHMLAIEELLDRKPATYSGGEMQRVALARAIVRRPRVYLMDQPLANLDARIRESMRGELKRLARELGQTIIFTTHDQLEAMSMGERTGVLYKGQLQQYDTPDVIYNHPRNRFVANFIGSPAMNFLDCSFEEREGRVFLVHEAFTLEVTELREAIAKAASTTELTIGIRPEHIQLSDKRPSKEAVKATVYITEPLGSRTIVTMKVGKNFVKAVVPLVATFKTGEGKYLEFDRTKLHVIDRKTEQTIV